MAEYSHRVVVTRRVEYFLPNPTNLAEFCKAYSAACLRANDDIGADRIADDTISVSANEEEIILSYVLPPCSDGGQG